MCKLCEGATFTVKVKDAQEGYVRHSQATSTITRQLALAGVAVVWLFRVTEKVDGREVPRLPSELVWPLALFVTAVALDLLQYVYYSVVWHRLVDDKERETGTTGDSEITFGQWVNRPGRFVWYAKVIVTVIAYVLLMVFLMKLGTTPLLGS